jgi:hypothetical protein
MKTKFNFDDAVLIVAIAALVYFRNWWASVFLVLVIAYLIFHHNKLKKSEPPANSNEFLIEDEDETFNTVELDIGLDYRPSLNYFRENYRFDTCQTTRLYEYRLEGTDVSCRLIEHQYEDIGVPEYRDVRDGVVLESEIRKRDAESRLHIFSVEDKITSFKADIQWHKMDSISWRGLKYFIISKKLPQPDARRYLRQELERLKIGEAALFNEAEKIGLERDDGSTYLDRLKVAEGNSEPSNEEIQKLLDSAVSLGISRLEFSWGNKLTGVLEKLLLQSKVAA